MAFVLEKLEDLDTGVDLSEKQFSNQCDVLS